MILNVTGGADLGLLEVNAAADLIQNSIDPDANIILGAMIDESCEDELSVTVIATGFESTGSRSRERKQLGRKFSISEDTDEDGGIDVPSFLR